VKPRVERRRRGHDFLANYASALAPALAADVDIVVHGGDVFDRSRVVPTLAYQALEPLCRVADLGIPVFIVPGNHERSVLPHLRFASHPGVHVFDRPRTWTVDVKGTAVSVSGFPYQRDVRHRFRAALDETEWSREPAQIRVLCMHQCAEGATVGPSDYTFRTAADVVRLRDVPSELAAVFSGHIHRHQVLTSDLSGRRLETPVLYPGSIERTSIAEIDETKGFMIVHIGASGVRWEFRELPARPMVRKELHVEGMSAGALNAAVRAIIADAPPDAVLSIRLTGELTDAQWRAVSSTRIREIAPVTMNVDITPASRFLGQQSRPRRSESSASSDVQLSF
jgi:DNA repair exonuclease SbcCD nuclease subunit